MTMTFEEVKAHLKQRFPIIMVDRVLQLQPGKSITTLKNVAGNEIQFLGTFRISQSCRALLSSKPSDKVLPCCSAARLAKA